MSVTGCALHKDHGSARPQVLVVHHLQPKSMGGPDNAGNRIKCCDTGHRSVHQYLRFLVFADIPEPDCTRSEKAAAKRGFTAWVKAGRPGNPAGVYAVHL